VMRSRQREERLITPGKLVDRRSGHDAQR
jgi:hypothetical protein